MTIQQHASFDSSAAELNATSKLVKAWESKNAKNAAKAGGISLMALSLAACGGSSTPVADAPAAADPVVPVVTPVTAALTIGQDTVTGTSANDTISGARIDGIVTWNPADVINGGAGTDSLTAVVAAGITPNAGAVTAVENITVTSLAAGTVTFSTVADGNLISGVENVTNLASAGNMVFARVVDLASISVNNTSTFTTAVTYEDSVLSGAADTVTLNLNTVGGAVTIGSVADTDGDYETIVINATGSASDLVAGGGLGADATTVTVNAAVALDLGSTASFAAVTNFNAAASTAGVTAVFANKAAAGTTAVSITGGSGNDNLDISALTAANHGALTVNAGAGNDTVVLGGQAASDFTISGGTGTDTLSISIVPASATHAGISGFETLTVTNALAAAATVDLSQLTANNGFNRVNANITTADNDGDGLETLTISNVAAGAFTLGMAALDVDDINVTVTRAVDGTTDAITVASSAASAAGTLSIADEETATFNSADGAIDYTAVTGTDMTSLVLTGDNTIDLGTITAAALATVDATGMAATANGNFVANMGSSAVAMTVTSNAATSHTGILNITTGTGNDTVTGTNNNDTINGGAGNDTINGGGGVDTIDGGTGADVINGGAGADEITGGAGADTLTGAAAADDFNFADGASGITVATADTITDFSTTQDDELDIAGYAVAAVATDLVIADGSAIADFTALSAAATAAFTAGAAGNTGDQIYASWNAMGTGNAYVFVDANDSGTFNAGDSLIILTGVNLVTEIVAGDFI